MVGLVMRLYRGSLLHPALGARLARLLGLLTAHLSSPRIRVVDGIRWKLDLNEVIDASLFFSGSFEPRAERVIAKHLGPGMTAIDIGANVGYHALRMARQVGAAGQVVAIEPAPGAVARLRRNLALNDFGNVAIVVAALGDRDVEEADLRLQSSYPLSGGGGPERVLTRVARLDSLVVERRLERVDFIKMDVDGQEGRVLRGARETLRRFRPPLLFELTPSAVEADGESVDGLLGALLDLGYSVADETGTRWDDPFEQAKRLRRGEGRNLVALPAVPTNRLPSST